MTIPLEGLQGLMTREGRFGYALRQINISQDQTVPAYIESIMEKFDNARDLVANVPDLESTEQVALYTIMPTIQTDAISTIQSMVHDDYPALAITLTSSITELIEQMRTNSESVQECTITATATAISGSTGTGVIVVSTKRGDGLIEQNTIAEKIKILCTSDAQSGGASAGQEVFTWTGAPESPSRWDFDWPAGSGASGNINAVTATEDAGTNLLTNSDFEDFTSNTPDNWTVLSGTPGTDILQSSTHYTGSSSVEYVGNGSFPTIGQNFNDADGTTAALLPDTQYPFSLWLYISATSNAGNLRIDLRDVDGFLTTDDQGTNNRKDIDLTTLAATTWTNFTGTFRTPKLTPSSGYRLVIQLETAAQSGRNLFIDHLAFAEMTPLYDSGPQIAIFSGATNFILNDGWNLVDTNNRGGQTYCSTFQSLYDRLFDMRGKFLLLPYSSSPTIPDNLITSSGGGSGT